MRLRTRIALAVLGGLILIVAAAALLVPRLVNLDSVRAVIVAQLSQRIGTPVTIATMRLFLLPLPHVRITDVHVSIPDRAEILIPKVDVHPRLTTLLSDRPQLESVQLDRPVIKLTVSGTSGPASRTPVEALPQSIAAAVAVASSAGAAIGPETALAVNDAQLLVDDTEVDLDAHDIDLHIRVGATQTSAITLELHGSLPSLAVRVGDESVDVRGTTFDAEVSVVGSQIAATLTSLEIESPRAQVSGRFSLDETPPIVELDITGKDVDVGSVRAAALSFAPNAALVEDIFDVLRGGTARKITVHGEAASIAELGDSIALRGTLSGGTIHIDSIGLDLQNVSGNATVVNNILSGEQASATVGNTRATEGSLRIGLSGDPAELHVQATVQTDAIDLQTQLVRIVGGDLATDLKRLNDVSGTLSGKLTIGGNTDDVTVLAQASQVDISAKYQGWPMAIQVSGGPITFDGASLSGNGLQINSGQTQLAATSLAIGLKGRPSLSVAFGPSRVVLTELYPAVRSAGLLRGDRKVPDVLQGTIAADTLSINGPLTAPDAWKVGLTGAVQGFKIESSAMGDFVALTQTMTLSNVRLNHDPAKTSTFSAMLASQGPVQGKLDVAWAPHMLNVKHLELRDRQSNATLSFLMQPATWSVTFAGRLVESTVAAFLPKSFVSAKAISGQFGTTIPLDRPIESTITGHVQIDELVFPLSQTMHWTVERLSVDGASKPAKINAVIETEHNGLLEVTGTVAPARDAIVVNLNASAARFDLSGALALVRAKREEEEKEKEKGGEKKEGEKKEEDDERYPPVRGTIGVAIDELTFDRYTWKPFRGTVALKPDVTTATITNANLCGIATPGKISVKEDEISVTVRPAAKNVPLDSTIECLFGKSGLATGQATMAGNFAGRGTVTEMDRALTGPLTFSATKGQVQNMPILSKVFSVISIATGSLENIFGIGDKALPYDQVTLKANMANGALRLTEGVLTGPTVKIVAEGSVDVVGDQLDLTLLVAPLVAADKLIGKIPVIRGIVGGNLVSIPVHVTGKLGEPAASLLPESGVSGTLIGVMKRTVSFPIKAIEGLFR